MSKVPEGYTRVVFTCEFDDEGNCPVCLLDSGECGCIGPTEEDDCYTVDYI